MILRADICCFVVGDWMSKKTIRAWICMEFGKFPWGKASKLQASRWIFWVHDNLLTPFRGGRVFLGHVFELILEKKL